MLRIFILNNRIVLFSSPFIIAGFILALQTPTVFDSGLYHIYYNEDITFFKTSFTLIKQVLLCIIGSVFFIRLIRENSSIGTFNLLRVLIENPVIPKPIDSTPCTFTYVYLDTVKIHKLLSDNRCFDYKIPCTHVDLSLIRLRRTTLQKGFKSMPIPSNSNK